MGLLNSALQIGRSALLSYQSALQVVGSNISSVGSPDYTRLTPELDPLQGNSLTRGLQPGAGVALTGIRRDIDEALEARVRLAISGQESASTQQATLARVEAIFDDQTGAGIAARLQAFFNSLDNLQNTPDDLATRDLVLSSASGLAESQRSLRSRLIELGTDADGQIAGLVTSANQIVRGIAELNERITRAEAGTAFGGSGRAQATGLRDQRDALLRDLSEIFDVTTKAQPNGALNVYVGSEVLVQGTTTRSLIAVEETDGEFIRTSVRFADTNAHIPVGGGKLGGLTVSRDQHAYARIAALDDMAAAVIDGVNRIHANGQGLAGYRSVVGTYDLLATDVALDSSATGLTFTPRNGSFFITVADDATGTPIAYRIDVELDGSADGSADGGNTTLESLVARMNEQVEGVTASITSDRRFALTAGEGFTFTFGHDGAQYREDTSNVLAALGINTLFTGSSAKDIAVSDALMQSPALLAAATANFVGDGTNAGRIAALESDGSDRLDGASLPGAYQTIANAVAVTASAVNDNAQAADTILFSLTTQKEAISGVNLDEEAIALLKFQRAFQGAARFITVVDNMLAELIALVR